MASLMTGQPATDVDIGSFTDVTWTPASAAELDANGVVCDAEAGWLRLRRGRHFVVCNFAATQQRIAAQYLRVKLASHPGAGIRGSWLTLPPWAVCVLEPD